MSMRDLERFGVPLLRGGLAFSFLYPPIAALIDPMSWVGYLPYFVRGIAPDEVLLHAFGVVEIVLALWLLSGVRVYIPAFLMAIILIAIVFLNPGNFAVLFRDLSIAAMALAVFVRDFKKSQSES
ncbi:MAG TPA: hypothetical protein VJH33_01410 [Candidatus Paceibacterota bacterium]